MKNAANPTPRAAKPPNKPAVANTAPVAMNAAAIVRDKEDLFIACFFAVWVFTVHLQKGAMNLTIIG